MGHKGVEAMTSTQAGVGRLAFGTGGVAWVPGQPLLLMLHGAGGDHTVWALQARAMARHGWNVAAPDLPGHGGTADDPALASIEALADWCARWQDLLRVPVAAVAGHSMGACIALTLAARHPGRVSALALLGAGESMRVNPELLDDSLNHKERADAFVASYGHGRGAHFGGAAVPGIWMLGATRALLERCPPAVLHRDFAACNAWEGDALAAKLRCPVLVLAGEADRMSPPKSGQTLASKIAGARFEVLPGTGHMLMAENPGGVTAALRRFFDPLRAGATVPGSK
jgi:pimeloyl-ACP methyl ester carboxylesterase